MAESLLVTPEINELDEKNVATNDAESSISLNSGHSNASHRRASDGSLAIVESLNKSKKKIPIYLRASTGSCHDFCKFGRRQEPEEKPWRKPTKQRTVKSLPRDFVQIVVSDKLIKEKVVKQNSEKIAVNRSPHLKPSPDIKSFLPKPKASLITNKTNFLRQNTSSGNTKFRLLNSRPLLTKSSPSPEIFKREITLPSKKVEVPAKKSFLSETRISRTEKNTEPLKSKAVKVKPSSSSSASFNDTRFTVPKTSLLRSSVKKGLVPSTSTLSPKFPSSEASPVKARIAGNLKLASLLRDRNKIRRFGTKVSSDNEKVPEKTLHVIKIETGNNVELLPDDIEIASFPPPLSNKSSSSTSNSLNLSSHKEEDEVTEYSGGEAEFVSDNNTESKFESKQPVKNNSPNKILRKAKVVVTEDKHRSPVKLKFKSGKVVDLNSDNTTPRKLRFRKARVLGADEVKGDMMNSSPKKAEVNNELTGKDRSSKKVVLTHNGVQEKAKVVVTKDKHRSPVKLKFQSGKVVDLNSDNTTPRKLRFRKARVLGADEGKGDMRNSPLKKTEVNNELTGEDRSSEKVVLKHNGVQEKDAQGLLNKVIKKTASKLVESRKSKVKALVGAFETVISLQESSKPSSHSVN